MWYQFTVSFQITSAWIYLFTPFWVLVQSFSSLQTPCSGITPIGAALGALFVTSSDCMTADGQMTESNRRLQFIYTETTSTIRQ